MKNKVKREIIAWRIFNCTRPGLGDIGIVLFKTTNGQLRATIGNWEDKDDTAMTIANTGERLLFEEAYPFFKHLPEMTKENYHPA